MTLSQAEAEKLAREIKQWATVLSDTKRYEQICGVCDHILSGSMKREIENAALRRAAEVAEAAAGMDGSPHQIKQQILALIQPPAQKENGE